MSALERAAAAKKQAEGERRVGNYEQAASLLERAIADLEGAMEASQPEERKRIAAELAESLGILGGIYKRQQNFAAAARAYDAGFQFESDPRFDVRSSYNALNRLIVRILMHPQSLTSASPSNGVNVPLKLRELRSTLQASLAGARQDDYWAAGDLALVCALLQDDAGAEVAGRHFVALSPPAYAYAAYQETLARLAEAAPEHKSGLENLSHHLTVT